MSKYIEKIIDGERFACINDFFQDNFMPLECHEEALEELKSSNEQLQNRSQEYQKDIKNLKKELKNYYLSKNFDKRELMDKYTHAKEQIQEITNEYEVKLEKQDGIINRLEQKIVELTENPKQNTFIDNNQIKVITTEYENKLKSTTDELDKLFLENQQLKDIIQKNNNSVLNQKLQTSHKNNENLRNIIVDLKKQLEIAQQPQPTTAISIDTEVIKTKIDNVRSNYDNCIQTLEDEVKTLQVKYKGIKLKYKELEKKQQPQQPQQPTQQPKQNISIDNQITKENIEKIFDIMFSNYSEQKVVNRIRVHKNQIKNKLLLSESKDDGKLDYGCEYFKKIIELYSEISDKNTQITKLNGVIEFLQNK
jgi:chromosome segregation ATPase